MSEKERKWGDGSLQAAFRQGFKEISQVLPAFPDSMRVVEEAGQLNNPTSLEVYDQRHEQQARLDAIDLKQQELAAQLTARQTERERSMET